MWKIKFEENIIYNSINKLKYLRIKIKDIEDLY